MVDAVLVVQAVSIVFLVWGAFLCLARRDRRRSPRDRRASARAGNAGRRRGDLVLVVNHTGDAAAANQPLSAPSTRPERYAA